MSAFGLLLGAERTSCGVFAMSVFTQGGHPLRKLNMIFKDHKPSLQPASVNAAPPVFHGGGQRMLSAPRGRDCSARTRRWGSRHRGPHPCRAAADTYSA